jgi:hypothetical protein
MDRTRLINVDHTVRKYCELANRQKVIELIVVVGKPPMSEAKNNYINFLYNDKSGTRFTRTIETEINDLAGLTEGVIHNAMQSNFTFDTVQATNFDGSALDIENLESSILIKFNK